MDAAVLAVGDELLLGDIVNSNAAWLGEHLAAVGARVVASAMVGDDVQRLATALRRALEDAEVVVVTGGLGPTLDDLTRDAIALVADVPLERSPALEDQLRERFAAFGHPMPEAVLRQADVPRGARVLDNPVGTAPGLRVQVGERIVYAVPGPPHEMRAVCAQVLPEVAARSGEVLTTRTLHCAGIGESAVAERVEAAVRVPDGVQLAYLAGGGVVRVRFTGTDPGVLAPLVEASLAALGDAVWGRDGDTLPGVVHALLAARSATVAVAESLTGGLVSAALTQLPGSSAGFRGGLLTYATDTKASLAGVPDEVLAEHGAVSEEAARAMADGVRARLGATYGVALTGVAGPEEQDGRPVGTVHVAVAGPAGTRVRAARLPGDRERVRLLAVTLALDLLRRVLQAPDTPSA
ncbi:MAG: competence/damage-inducible protein A [Actinomycetota bacterium]|nr:competence/damage-inducible protein A [Actinomycetota bacterium]